MERNLAAILAADAVGCGRPMEPDESGASGGPHSEREGFQLPGGGTPDPRAWEPLRRTPLHGKLRSMPIAMRAAPGLAFLSVTYRGGRSGTHDPE